jgi:hypothetical protein
MKLRLGSDVATTDGVVGTLKGIVVEAGTPVVSHLDVSSHHHDVGRLVPVQTVALTDAVIHLACTSAQYADFHPNIVRDDVRDLSASFGYQYADNRFGLPTVIGSGRPGMDLMGLNMASFGGLSGMDKGIARDAVPDDEFDLEHRAHIHATDGNVGHVDGVVVDGDGFQLTDLLLAEGHFLGEREVAIPITSVTQVNADGAQVSLSKAEIESLPPISL